MKNIESVFGKAMLTLIVAVVFSGSAIAEVLVGSSSESPELGNIYTIDTSTGVASFVNNSGLGEKISALEFNSRDCSILGVTGGSAGPTNLVTIDESGTGTVIAALAGSGFSNGGSGALTQGPDFTLYASGWSGGLPGGSFLVVDGGSGAVTRADSTTGGAFFSGLEFDQSDVLWGVRGGNGAGLYRIDPANGATLETISMTPDGKFTELAISETGTMYASMTVTGGSDLVTIDTATGAVTTIGFMGDNIKIAGLTFADETCIPLAAPVQEPVPGLGSIGTLLLVLLMLTVAFMGIRYRKS